MILTCPQCATRYLVGESELPPDGRKVRCTRCGTVWHQRNTLAELISPDPFETRAHPAAFELTPEPASVAAHEAEQPQPEGPASEPLSAEPPAAAASAAGREWPRKSGERAAAAVGWIALAGVVGLLVWTGLRHRDLIVSIWPSTAPLYTALGLPVGAHGLAFDNIDTRRELTAGRTVLIVRGTVRNTGPHDMRVPRIRVALTDDHDRTLDSWLFSAGVDRLAPGEKIAFSSRRPDPPENSRHLEMTFAVPDN